MTQGSSGTTGRRSAVVAAPGPPLIVPLARATHAEPLDAARQV